MRFGVAHLRRRYLSRGPSEESLKKHLCAKQATTWHNLTTKGCGGSSQYVHMVADVSRAEFHLDSDLEADCFRRFAPVKWF
jgi:hypothetical protein